MTGTLPTSYSVPVTQELSDGVITGQWPNFDNVDTKVLKWVTLVGQSNRRLSEGMETPEYRRVTFQRIITFEALAKSQWEKFLVEIALLYKLQPLFGRPYIFLSAHVWTLWLRPVTHEQLEMESIKGFAGGLSNLTRLIWPNGQSQGSLLALIQRQNQHAMPIIWNRFVL